MRNCKVVIVEPSKLIAEGLRTMLDGSEFDVVAVYHDISSLMMRISLVEPQVVVIGTQALSYQKQSLRYTYPQLQDSALVLLMTSVCEEEWSRQVDAVINVYDSASQIVSKLQSALEQSQTNPYSDSHELSERERDVLTLVANGFANKEIADRLNISVHTVVSHRKNIAHKTGVRSVAGLTVYAILNNLVDPSDVSL